MNFRDASNNDVFYRVDADLPVVTPGTKSLYYAQTANNTMWVPIVEKAFAEFRRGANTYQSIWNGRPTEGFSALGLNQTGTLNGSSSTQTLLNIKAALDGGRIVTVDTPNSAAPSGVAAVQNHTYAVVSVSTVSIFGAQIPISITLRNPWGFDRPNSNRDNTDGLVTFTAQQFGSYFTTANSAWA